MNGKGRGVLITGGAGFIGANLARYLLDTGEASDIHILDDLSSGYLSNLEGLDVEFHQGTVLDDTLVSRLADRCQTIVHLAAVPSVPRSIADPLRTHVVNTTGSLHVLEAARVTGAHVIVASSSSVYGSTPTLPKSETLRCKPASPYAVSKLAAEAYALAYARCYSLPVLAFRFFNVFGPCQSVGHAYAAVIPAFLSAALRNEPIVIHGDGTQTRDFTFVGTVVEVIGTAIRNRVVHDDAVNLAFGTRISLLELIAVVEDVLGKRIAVSHQAPRRGDVRDSQADASRLVGLFPLVHPVPLREALVRTARWYGEFARNSASDPSRV